MSFSQFLLILRARYPIILLTLLVTVATTVVVTMQMPKTYKATASLVVNYKGSDPLTGMTLPAQLMPGYMATQVDIIQSHNVGLKVVDQLDLASSPAVQAQFNKDTKGQGDIKNWLADLLLNKLDVEPSKQSSVINISFDGTDPQFAAEVANAFALAYQQTNIQLKVDPSKKASTYLTEQVNTLREKLEQAQQKLSRYQHEKGFTSVDERLDVESARLNELSAQLVAAQAQSYEAKSRQQHAVSGAGASPDVMSNPLVQNLKAQLTGAESKLAELSEKLDKNHPQYQAALAEVEKIRNSLNNEIRNVSRGVSSSAQIFQQRESEIRAALAAQKEKVLALNRQRDEFNILQKEVESNQRTYDAAMLRLSQTKMESQVDQSDIAVLNPAVPPLAPDSPKPMLNTILSVFLGTLLGLGFAFLAEMLNRRVRSREDVRELLDLPVLGQLGRQQLPQRKRIFLPKELQPFPVTRPAVQMKNARIGRLLMDMGKITPEDTQRVLHVQKEQGLRFGDAAQTLGMVSEADVRQALAMQFDYHYLEPGEGNFSNELVAAYHPFSKQVEGLRALRSQLMLRWFSEGRRLLAVTSTSDGEGCSYVVANLAVLFSQLGEKTLLIDANLRSPRQHEIFNLNEPRGLSDILAGRSGLDVVTRVDAFLDLSVLGAGTVPPNPQELLNRNNFPALLTQLADHYDVVLIDTTPVSVSLDMQAIVARTGGALVVARQDKTRMVDVDYLKQQINETGAMVLGVVLNDY